jgi:predicted RNA-binding protein YlxR (DUF448 family)
VAAQDELVRVVARSGGGLAVGRNEPGRGAWVCAGSVACLDAAQRRRAFDRALRTTLDAGAVEDLKTTIASRGRLDS